ncbi:MAG: DUF72 domain-containing protein [Thermoleophilia bacterium]
MPPGPEIRIGTSGWNYSHWRELFYPRDLRQKAWLEFYSKAFDTVEINSTFYRLPKPEYVDNWADSTPGGFLFAVKGSRYLTHLKRLGETGEPLDRFFDLLSRLGDKAGPVLWQLPPQMKRDDDRLSAFVGSLPGGWRHTFEFRNPEWFCPEVYEILERAGMALCFGDHPERPQEPVQTTGWSYLRFHYGENDGSYSQAQLDEWAGYINGHLKEGVDVYAYFNNDANGHALKNAETLRCLLAIAPHLS